MLIVLTVGIVGGAFLLLSLALVFTGKSSIHGSCSAGNEIEGVDTSCAFCPNGDDEDQYTSLSKVGYRGRKDIVSEELYVGRKNRNIVVERLKYNSGRE